MLKVSFLQIWTPERERDVGPHMPRTDLRPETSGTMVQWYNGRYIGNHQEMSV